MNGAQIAMIALLAMGAGVALAKNGQPNTGKHNFFSTLIAQGVLVSILYWGGFWSAA